MLEVEIFLNDLDPLAVRVELYADGINGGDPVRKEMNARGRFLTHHVAASITHRTHCTSRDRLHGTSDTAALRRGGSVGVRANSVAAMMKSPQPELHDHIPEISERDDIRAGFPLPLGTQETGGGVNFAIFSRYARRVRLELFDHPEDAYPPA